MMIKEAGVKKILDYPFFARAYTRFTNLIVRLPGMEPTAEFDRFKFMYVIDKPRIGCPFGYTDLVREVVTALMERQKQVVAQKTD